MPGMSATLTVVLNGEPRLRYERDKALSGRQAEYLERMDERMNAGVELDGVHVPAPDSQQRVRFVAMQLVQALVRDDEALSAAMTGYLASRLPDLQQVRVRLEEGEAEIDLVFDEPYRESKVVQFVQSRADDPTTRH
jgi:hypothetical protein